jgi:hypothetical protein
MYKYYSNNRKNPPLCASFATASATTNPVIRLIRPKRLIRPIRPITLIYRHSHPSIRSTLPGKDNHELLRPTKSRKLNFEVERLPFKDCLVSLQSENIFTIQNGNY